MFAEHSISADDFDNICRFCLAIQQADVPIKFNPIFKENGIPVNRALLKMITACLGLDDISATDGLPQNVCSTCIKQLLTCNSFRQSCISSDIYLKNVLRLNDEATSVKVDPDPDTHEEYYAADVEVVQSEIEAETYEIDEVTGENGEVTTYYINTDVANAKMDLDHDYYIEASDMKIVTISDTKPLRITTTNANIIEAETVTDVVDNEQVTIIADGSAIDDVPDHIHHEQLIDQNGCDARGPVDQNRDLCIICGSMQSKGNLRRHMETHLGEKRRQPFACQHCDRKFINRPSFEAHVNKHIGVKPFQCKVCDKTFYGSNLLRTHMYSHSTENKYACSDCDKVFRYPHYLSQHRRIHRANTVYRCEHCEYTNVYLHNYKNHLRKHTGEYKFSCKLCSKGFSRKLLYMRHMEKHVKKE